MARRAGRGDNPDPDGSSRGFDRVERCQFEQSLRRWPPPSGVARRAALVALRYRAAHSTPTGLGAPSRFDVGGVVRVKAALAITPLLDERHRTRGLVFTDSQWAFCGTTLIVDRVVRHMLEHRQVLRPLTRAVTLAGATCDAGSHGCGRGCALLFKDEWLEPAPDADASDLASWQPPTQGPLVRIRTAEEIRRTLGPDGWLDGVAAPLDVDHYQGQVFQEPRRVRMPSALFRVVPVPPVGNWFVIDATRRAGRELAHRPPCDRRCALVWHRSWLEFLD